MALFGICLFLDFSILITLVAEQNSKEKLCAASASGINNNSPEMFENERQCKNWQKSKSFVWNKYMTNRSGLFLPPICSPRRRFIEPSVRRHFKRRPFTAPTVRHHTKKRLFAAATFHRHDQPIMFFYMAANCLCGEWSWRRNDAAVKRRFFIWRRKDV